MTSRRQWLASTLAAAVGATALPAVGAGTAARVLVIGGGFAGASCARALRASDRDLQVSLVEPQPVYTACPFSNLVLAGRRALDQNQFNYAGLRRSGVNVVQASAVEVDPVIRRVSLSNGATLAYDRLVLAPGIELDFEALPGYDQQATERMPHAWQAGTQTTLLRRQLAAMPDGGLVVIAVPESPYRCPPGPYERASLIASYLKSEKPRSKILILDAKDHFSKEHLFRDAWRARYGEMIEWQGVSDGARVVSVDPVDLRLHTDFDTVQAAVANVIPPQKAGLIAARAGVADASGWCPVQPATFESTRVPLMHVIGDAAIANAMPKSAFAANAQANLCAVQVARLLAGRDPLSTKLINTCYSLVDEDYGISVAGVYQPGQSEWIEIDGAGGTSPAEAGAETRSLEARYAHDWFNQLTRAVFG